MAYMTNKQFDMLGKMWTEIRDNNGYVSTETFEKFSELMREFQADKREHSEKYCKIIAERRKVDKNYARSKTPKNYNPPYKELKERARQEAIQWQKDFEEHNYSYEELWLQQIRFEKLARQFGLRKEFRENGII